MELFFTNRRQALATGAIPGVGAVDLADLFERRLALDGTPILLDEAMRPVEPLSSWFRHLGLMGRSAKTMRKYAYIALRLSEFLVQAGADVLSATETDLLEYRALRTREQVQPISKATWEVEATAINGLYAWLVGQGHIAMRPWRSDGRRSSLRNGVSRDMRVRHMTLEQYRYFRDVGLAGQLPDGSVDRSFRGRSPHRSRAGVELGLLTGMRLGEWSTLLLLELGLDAGRPREGVEIRLAACAKFGRAHTVYVPRAALDLAHTYVLMERRHVVQAAQASLARRRADLFVVNAVQDGRGKLRGVLDGLRVTRSIAQMPPELRAITVMDTGSGLEPMTLFRSGRNDAPSVHMGQDPVARMGSDALLCRAFCGTRHADAPVGLPRSSAHVCVAAVAVLDAGGRPAWGRRRHAHVHADRPHRLQPAAGGTAAIGARKPSHDLYLPEPSGIAFDERD